MRHLRLMSAALLILVTLIVISWHGGGRFSLDRMMQSNDSDAEATPNAA